MPSFAITLLSRGRLATLALGILAVMAMALWSIDRVARVQAMNAAQADARNEAMILTTSLQSELDKFSLVPLVLAEDPQVISLLQGSAGEQAALNRRLEALARQTNAAVIYLMDARGLTRSASNWSLPTSFVGSNYSFRRYFKGALKAGSATQFALGTVSRKPGLYIAQRIEFGGRLVGVVAVKVEFDAIEANWRAATRGVYVTDRDGVVLLTSNGDWRFRTTDRQMSQLRDRDLDLRQFGIRNLKPLDPTQFEAEGGAVATPLLDTEQPIALEGWTLHLLADPNPRIDAAMANGRFYLLLAIALMAALIGVSLHLRRRRELLAEALLTERTLTLREQLNQANRLATLGQVSVGVGHEINQPVAAIRLFAENGRRFLSDGRTSDADENFLRIVEMTERIGLITSELRRFARRDAAEPQVFELTKAIDGALLLLRDRLERSGTILLTPPRTATGVLVRAEPVRLEQVLVNLLQNAIDATGPDGQITLSVEVEPQACCLRVADNGPGLLPAARERLFQPFATTKPNGLGLGLVISRGIMRDLGGDLTLATTDSGMATTFVMRIPRA